MLGYRSSATGNSATNAARAGVVVTKPTCVPRPSSAYASARIRTAWPMPWLPPISQRIKTLTHAPLSVPSILAVADTHALRHSRIQTPVPTTPSIYPLTAAESVRASLHPLRANSTCATPPGPHRIARFVSAQSRACPTFQTKSALSITLQIALHVVSSSVPLITMSTT